MMVPLVDLYELRDGVYVKTMADRNFQDFLEQDLGYTVIPASRKDQNLYGLNFLTVRSDRILAIDGVIETYKQRLQEHGVDATWMDFGALYHVTARGNARSDIFLGDGDHPQSIAAQLGLHYATVSRIIKKERDKLKNKT
ncbi:hypothetical protein [Desulfonatronovibrio magnus]|uniref:hypothetical protein n=1 Tax=Desulfonatronovibrio magnus TaxID=698827 RepID=UPI0005EBE209|nr:hypothetical protein [Desulfonatronovibrio magnus]